MTSSFLSGYYTYVLGTYVTDLLSLGYLIVFVVSFSLDA